MPNNINFNIKKPTFELKREPLSDVRSSKAYLWGYVRELLEKEQNKSILSLKCLDAACHSLITRDMIPEEMEYYGVDISLSRLNLAMNKKKPKDQLYWADLTEKLNLSNCFDVVLSLNTLSHLPFRLQKRAVNNLIECCHEDSLFIVNTTISENLMNIFSAISNSFENIKIIYFDSYLSHNCENKALINPSNVLDSIVKYEFNIPNIPVYHRQVLFIAKDKFKTEKSCKSLPPREENSVLKLNDTPKSKIFKFKDDAEMLNHFSEKRYNNYTFCLTSRLYHSKQGVTLIKSLTKLGYSLLPLSSDLDNNKSIKKVIILGLEKGWSDDENGWGDDDDDANDRLHINFLRSELKLDIALALVSERNGRICTPSLLTKDI